MNILRVIKKRTSIRKFLDKPIAPKILQKILDAGIWGPSLARLQPVRFFVTENASKKNVLGHILEKKIAKLGVSGRIIFGPTTITALESAPLLIAVYNTGEFKKLIGRFACFVNQAKNNRYLKVAEQAEISAISAGIQNMVLTIEDLGLASCWLHVPLYCQREINKVFNTNYNLIAILAIGYPAVQGKRSPRRPRTELITYYE